MTALLYIKPLQALNSSDNNLVQFPTLFHEASAKGPCFVSHSKEIHVCYSS